MNEYDQRQYRRMSNLVKRFEKGDIEIDLLISDLDALLECLQDVDRTWKEKFRNAWASLEIEHALALDQGKKGVDKHSKVVMDALATMKSRLSEVLKPIGPSADGDSKDTDID